jgi:hypothetical protein
VFAVAVVARLHELNHAAIQTASGGAHHQAQRAGGFSFTVSGMDHQEATRVFLVVSRRHLYFLAKLGSGTDQITRRIL